jgi:hypothetical protein
VSTTVKEMFVRVSRQAFEIAGTAQTANERQLALARLEAMRAQYSDPQSRRDYRAVGMGREHQELLDAIEAASTSLQRTKP